MYTCTYIHIYIYIYIAETCGHLGLFLPTLLIIKSQMQLGVQPAKENVKKRLPSNPLKDIVRWDIP